MSSLSDLKNFDFVLDEDFNELIAATDVHTGAMVALIPSEVDADRLAVDGGEDVDQLHLTLCYLGEAAMIPAEVREEIVDAVSRWASELPTVVADGFAINLFNPPDLTAGGSEPCVVLGVSGGQLDFVHELIGDSVQGIFERSGVAYPEQHKPWIPHVTLVYTGDADLAMFIDRIGPITFDRVRVAFAGENYDIPLGDSLIDEKVIVAAFDPNQPRDDDGQWTDSPSGSTITLLNPAVQKIASGDAKTQGDVYSGIKELDQEQWNALSSSERDNVLKHVKGWRGKNTAPYHKGLVDKIDGLVAGEESGKSSSLKKSKSSSSQDTFSEITPDNAEAMMNKMLVDDPWNDEDQESLLDYTEDSYGFINDGLRHPENDNTPNNTKAVVTRIDNALRPLPKAIKTYRRVTLNAFGPNITLNNIRDVINTTRQDPAFLSTSISKHINPAVFGDVLLEMNVPKGIRGAYVENISHLGEFEMLLEAGLTLNITDVQVDGDQVHIKITVER